jgi:hypothetical protein
VKGLESIQKRIKAEYPARDIRKLQLRLIELENKLSNLEKKGTRIKPRDLISMAFFATVSSAILVVSLVLLLLL